MNRNLTRSGSQSICINLAAVALACFGVSLHAQDATAYDNLPGTQYGSFAALDFRGNPTEFGDEIALAGTARTVTKFIFDYYGNFTPNGDETARIRFYANDGPGVFLKPNTLLYESPAFSIVKGEARVTLDIPYVEVPNSFTWTVSFSGVTQTDGDSAELVVVNPPSVGAQLAGGLTGSYRDYWKFNAGVWTVYMLTNNWPANFAAKIVAQEEIFGVQMALDRQTGQLRFRWPGKPSSQYKVQSSTDFLHWTDLALMYGSKEGFTEYTVTPEPGQPVGFYRIVRVNLPSPRATVSVNRGTSPGEVILRWTGGPNLMYQIKYSEDLKNWTYLNSVKSDAEGKADYTDRPPARFGARFYQVWSPW